MGQIFWACAYDIENKKCFVKDADKFHANCFSCSGTVVSIHYLLRQKPYHIMWGGGYIVIHDYLKHVSRTEVLLGISTYEDYEDFERNNEDLKEKSYYDKVKFIDENNKLWEKLHVLDEALIYFDWENTRSVKYSGYLINHTKKLAVDLTDYYEQSRFLSDNGIDMCIDAVPVLTETGGGTEMALFDGVCTDSTEELSRSWCGDLLQIVPDLPTDFEVINCCFAEIWCKAEYCYKKFGVNEKGLLLKNESGELYKAAPLGILGDRGLPSHIKVELTKDKIRYIPEYDFHLFI
ncbi:MAG: hypothetical protein FWC47_09730 [Oscillospiraceae bacterium]|nr:hypothetical protein [Oscillospiraceae bacterium]